MMPGDTPPAGLHLRKDRLQKGNVGTKCNIIRSEQAGWALPILPIATLNQRNLIAAGGVLHFVHEGAH